MLHDSTRELIRKLYELTDAGVLAWTAGDANRARLETEGYVVEVDAEPPSLRLLNADGREFQSACAADLAAASWPGSDATFASRVAEMATRARKVARGDERPAQAALTALSAPPRSVPARPRGPIFGAIDSFVRPGAALPMMTRISASTIQPTQQDSGAELQRMLAPPPRPVRPPPAQVERPAHGPHIYKPWN